MERMADYGGLDGGSSESLVGGVPLVMRHDHFVFYFLYFLSFIWPKRRISLALQVLSNRRWIYAK